MSDEPTPGVSSLAADLRANDPDRYLATLFAPAEVRDALFALYAFDHEITKVRQRVREPMAGLIRLQWWRDVLDAIETAPVPAHPVAQALHRAITRCGLVRSHLQGAIDARERELAEPPPLDLLALEDHLLATSASLVHAALGLLGSTARRQGEIADRIGLVRGYLELLRSPAAPDGRPAWLPEDLLAAHGLAAAGPAGESGRANVRSLRAELAARGLEHLAHARQRPFRPPRRLLPAFFPGTLAATRLRSLQRSGARPAVAAAPIRLVWLWLRGRF